MDENKNQQPRRGFGRVILPYLIILAAIAAFIVLIVRATSAKVYKWNSDAGSLDKALADNQIVTAEVYNKETTVEITGTFYPISNPNEGEKKFDVVIDVEKYNHTFETGSGTHAAYSTLFEKEINEYKAAFPDKADKAYIKDVYAFQVSWWDQWGPSIISIIVTVLIALLLFSMLSRSVNGSNNKAMDFNRSRARKVDSSKVIFGDVAGVPGRTSKPIFL